MAAFLDLCRFTTTLGGLTDWTFSGAVGGCQSPSAAGAVNGRVYKFYAVSADLTQWELSEGAYNSSTGVFARTTVIFSSAASNAKVNFTAAPQVSIVAVKEDLISVEEANSFTTTQQDQARSNILAGKVPALWTKTTLLSGSGTYTTPTGCKAIRVRAVGGGGGGANGGSGALAGSPGSNTTFGTTFLIAGGGGGGPAAGFGYNSGVASSGGDHNISGGYSTPSFGAGGYATGSGGMCGMAGPFGAQTPGGWAGGDGISAAANTGSGGGGGGGNSQTGGGGGGSGGYVEKWIVSPLATYSYAVGAGGAKGTGGAQNGGIGGSGIIVIEEFY